MRTFAPPQAVVLSACRSVEPGMQRIKGDFGVQFDIPMAKFSVEQGSLDMPPEEVFLIALKEDGAKMMVATRYYDDFRDFQGLAGAFPLFSRHVGEREVRFADGRVAGGDRWGELKSGERWRYVTFHSGDAAGYRPVPLGDARWFDQVLGSACNAAR